MADDNTQIVIRLRYTACADKPDFDIEIHKVTSDLSELDQKVILETERVNY